MDGGQRYDACMCGSGQGARSVDAVIVRGSQPGEHASGMCLGRMFCFSSVLARPALRVALSGSIFRPHRSHPALTLSSV